VTSIDGRLTRDMFQMGGGTAALAIGADFRKEEFTYDLQDIARQAASSGLELAADISGDRDVTGLFAEMAFPFSKQLELTLAARYDNYSDFGNTVNPKIGVRWQPMPTTLFRGSFNTGFRAPTLYDIYQPIANTFTSDPYDDPVLCPGGTAVAGADPTVVCGQQVQQRLSGPVAAGKPVDSLEPEESQTFTFGFVFEPMPNLTFSIDYWDIKIENVINSLPEQAIFGDPVKYDSRILRCSQLDAATRAVIDVCNNVGFDPIAYIDTPTENLGEIKTRGIDIGFSYRTASTPYGVWGFTFDGTYVDSFKYQREKGGEFIQAAGAYSDNAPVLRWQHVAVLGWNAGPFGSSLAWRYKSGYKDQDPSNEVRQYTLYDLGFTYTGVRNLTFQFVIKNLLDQDPPYTNQGSTFQANYDPRLTDPLGRTFSTKVAYRF
jgi:iron complex outermembrane receptor protein